MRRLPFFVLLLPILFSTLVFGQSTNVQTGFVPISPAPYRVGERLTYNVTFANFINAAHVELTIAGRGQYFDREGVQLRAHVETTEVVNAALYAINNDYASFVDPATGQPYRVQQVVRKGGRTSEADAEFNIPAGTDALPPKVLSGGFPGTYDFLAAVYRLRALPLSEGATYRFTARSENKEYQVEARVSGREMVKTNVGSFDTIVVRLKTAGDSRANDMNITLYFSDDERHVPALITVKLKAGMVRAELAGSEFVQPAVPGAEPASTRQSIAQNNPPLVQGVNPQAVPGVGGSSSRATTSPSEAAQPGNGADNLPFKIGEQLNYNVYLGSAPQPVGIASFEVKARARYFNRDGIQVVGGARTTGPVGRVFTANDQVTSYLDPISLLPFRTELRLQEGTRRQNRIVSTDQDRGNAVVEAGERIEVPVGTHDMLSVLYAMRAFNLAPPRRNAVSILINNRPRTLFVTSLGREKIDLNGTSVSTIQLTLTTDDAQNDKYGLRLWITDDKRRIPVRVIARTELGPVRADLAIIPTNEQ